MKCEPARNPAVAWVEVDGDVVAITPTGDIHVLTGAAAAVWQLIDGSVLDGLAVVVADEFGVALAAAQTGIDDALAMLDRIGLIVMPTAG